MGRPWEKLPFYRFKFASKVFGVKSPSCFSPAIKNLKKKPMFGFDEINWEAFIQFIIYALCLWYLGLFVFFWFMSRGRNREQFFENYNMGESNPESLQPISVSSKDFPSELLPILSEKQVVLETSFYEETGLDEGYGIDHFTDENNPKLSEILPEIQYQH